MLTFDTTPNPHALQVRFADGRSCPPLAATLSASRALRSYRASDAAANALTQGDTFAAAILAVPGISSVLVSEQWFSVVKAPSAEWPSIKADLRRALRPWANAVETGGRDEPA